MDHSPTISQAINSSYACVDDLYKVTQKYSPHIIARKLFSLKKYSISRGNVDDQQRWSNLFQQELLRHLAAEQIILDHGIGKDFHEHGYKEVRSNCFLFFRSVLRGTVDCLDENLFVRSGHHAEY